MYWQCSNVKFTFERPLIMGILNVTPDSFSDGGAYNSVDNAVKHACQLTEAGADIIDVGGESTRPGAKIVNIEEEKRRVLPVVEKLAKQGITVSLDTMKPALMRIAHDYGAKIINDVNGFSTTDSIEAVSNHNCGLVIMHMQGQPQTMQNKPHYNNVINDIAQFINVQTTKLINAGIDKNRLCVDPGIGFGKTFEHNAQILTNPSALTKQFPLLIGVSRKSFFISVTGDRPAAKRDVASAVAAAIMALRGAHVFRVHNVGMTLDALKTAALLSPSWNENLAL